MCVRIAPPAMVIVSLVCLGLCTAAGRPCDFESTLNFFNCSSRGLFVVPGENSHFNDSQGIDLSYNSIERLKGGEFSKTCALKYLDLAYNNITELNSEAFRGLETLITLNLSGNFVNLASDVITPQLFDPLVSLQEIRIQDIMPMTSSKWKGVDAAFGKLKGLRRLYIDYPHDFVFGEGFRELFNLTTISTAGRRFSSTSCQIGALRNSTFCNLGGLNIKELRLINCLIEYTETGTFDPLTSLDTLDVSNSFGLGLNQAVGLLRPFYNQTMKEIKLQRVNNGSCSDGTHFVLNQNSVETLSNLCIKSLDLSQNYISSIEDFPGVQLFYYLEHFNISFHSLRCFTQPFFTRMFVRSIVLKSFDVSYGFGMPQADNGYYFLSRKYNRKPGYDVHDIIIPASLQKLYMTSIFVRIYFNKPFTFYNAKHLWSLSFAYNNFGNCVDAYVRGLDNLTELDVSGISCSHMSGDFFLHLRRLKKLSLSNSQGMDFSSSSLSCFDLLEELESIDLSGNKITELHPSLFQHNRNVMEINLANNKLQRLPSALFQIAKLKRLDLSANAFTHLQSDEMALMDGWITRSSMQRPFSLIMTDNPIQCTCDTVLFIRWVISRKIHLDHPDNYTCLLSNGSRMTVYEFRSDMRNFEVSCVSSTYIVISVVAISTSLILILSLIGMYRYRLNLKYWLYTRLKPPKDMFASVEYVFDAFVAYTNENREWVVNHLRPELEQHDDPFKLCIHDRDFLPGTPIHENIVDNMRKSRKVLMIISRHFLDSTYGPLEIEYAGMKCLDEGRDDVIVCVLMEELPVRQMPKALRSLWHKITFLKWSDDPGEQGVFWQRLIHALR